MRAADLYWLPVLESGGDDLRRLARSSGAVGWSELVGAAVSRLDFVQTNRLDKIVLKHFGDQASTDSSIKSLRIAVMSSSTADHLAPGLRVAGLRRNVRVRVYVGDYGQYRQELQSSDSALCRFQPEVFLFAFHAQHLFGNLHGNLSKSDATELVESVSDKIRQSWRSARQLSNGQIIQQTIIPTYQPLLGSNEHRLPGSGANLVDRINIRLRELADEESVDILALDRCMANDGAAVWHDPGLWHLSKQEISPLAVPAYGDFVMRLVDARQGRSFKCLVLDLDNILWGGMVGDDGVEGIRLGHGSVLGESYVEFQNYVRGLSKRGVVLAVCSKNDPAAALAPFEIHPDMVLKSDDIACFVANWDDKAANIRTIAARLNVGLDSLVFADDSPFERNIVRRELPMVAVPELPEDPAYYARCLADAGYFEAVHLSSEDFDRSGHYRENAAREDLLTVHTDLAGYLNSLNMQLLWSPFDRMGLQRIVQLINKTNQFNLRTRRYTEQEVLAVMKQPDVLTLQLRLVDRFGDNGIIGIVIATPQDDCLKIDTWLMSCRVVGRHVEQATINIVVEQARKLHADRLLGEYLPTKKNDMVRDHYQRLGFSKVAEGEDGSSQWILAMADFRAFSTPIVSIGSDVRGQ
jgi:FkbH-like protein